MFDDDLDTLLARYDASTGKFTRKLVATVLRIRPDFSAKVAFGWNTINFRHREAGFVSAIYLSRDHVSLVFQDGRLLDSPLLTDDGKVKKVRWIPMRPGDRIPVDEIAILYAEAIALHS